MAKVVLPGRYFREELNEFFKRIWRAGRVSKLPVPSERVAGLIDNSLERDFREGMHKYPHGWDALSIANKVKTKVESQIDDEKAEQEIEYLNEVLSSLRSLETKVEHRLEVLQSDRGNVAYIARNRDLHEAYLRIEERKRQRSLKLAK